MKEHRTLEAIKEEIRKLEVQQRELRWELSNRRKSEGRSEAEEAICAWLQTFPKGRIEKLKQLLEDNVMCRECGPGTLRIMYYDATVACDMEGNPLELFEYGEADHICAQDERHTVLYLSEYNFTVKDFTVKDFTVKDFNVAS